MAGDRSYLRAYLTLQAAHKLLHRAIKAFEEDCSDTEILRRIEAAQQSIQDAQRHL